MQKDNDFLVVGIVGHIRINDLADFKLLIDKTPEFKLIFFKTSSEKLWIKEGGSNE